MKDQATQCCKRVYTGSFGGHMCQKPAKHEHQGKQYCATHYPPTVYARRDAKQKKWEEKFAVTAANHAKEDAERAEQKRRADLYPELLEALEEIDKNDPFHQSSAAIIARAAIAKATGSEA